MKGSRQFFGGMRVLAWLTIAVLVGACASMGRPEGGPRDEQPPVFVSSNPAPGARQVKRTNMTVIFDENVQLEDAFSKVVVSPAQKQPPAVSANGKRVSVEFRDTLLPNTTYTIDFADAIKDLNEGNILDGFALDFSTGDSLDTLRMSGIVLQAENLEPAQGMLVGVYSNLADSAIHTLPVERIARTNQYGQFTIRNLKPGTYRIFALNDLNHDYHWDRSEDIAFYDAFVSPSTEAIEITDTLYAADKSDSLVQRQGIRFLPNDILLTWFNEGYKSAYLSDYKRPERRRITLTFGAPQDTLPEIRIVEGGTPGLEISEWGRLRANATRDSLEYWIADTSIVAADTLRLSVRYLRTDSNEALSWTTDTLRFNFRDYEKKKDKKKKKKNEEEVPLFIVDSITGDTTFLPPPDMEYLSLKLQNSSSLDLNRPVVLESNLPIDTLDSQGVHLEIQNDTLWDPVAAHFVPDSSNLLMLRRMDVDWVPGGKYRLTIDTLAVNSIYNVWNRPFMQEFTVKQPEDYSSLTFILPGLDSVQTVVQLLNTSDAPVYQTVKPAGDNKAVLKFLNPGTYYARLYIDDNENRKWDTGNLKDSVQPEEVYYFAKKLNLKKNWDIEQTWDITELAIDAQKPYAIKKNKPKLKRGEQAPGQYDEEEEDEFYDPFGGNNRGGNNRGGNNRGTGNRRGFGGGLQQAGGPIRSY